MRYFIELAYNGKAYFGWQFQPDAVSVQETLEKALYVLLQQPTPVTGAGRTDTGVHASRYFAHFETDEIINREPLIYKLNSILPEDIAVYDVFRVPDDAHARFDALTRSYNYNVIQRKDPFRVDRFHYVKNKLDVDRMNRAAALLKNYTDFKSFSKSKTDVKTYNCKITEAYWEREGELLTFHITANRFLRNMVRAIVGTLLDIGLHKLELEDLHKIIESRDRQKAGTSVPAKALFLTGITYPGSIVRK